MSEGRSFLSVAMEFDGLRVTGDLHLLCAEDVKGWQDDERPSKAVTAQTTC